MVRTRGLAIAGVFALAGCAAHGTDLGFQAAVESGEDFTISEVVGPDVERAYVFCPYSSKEEAEQLGFNPDDVPGIDDDYQAWETASGIGVISANRAEIEWFDPSEVDACEPGSGPIEEVDPTATVHIDRGDVTVLRFE